MSLDLESDELLEILTAYNARISTAGRLGLTSSNKRAENVCMRLLNALYGWSLENANAAGVNEKAIDLKDEKNRIVVQVTATYSAQKINGTLGSKKAAEYHRDGYRLVFAFVGSQDKANKVQGESGWAIRDPHDIGFDRRLDTLFTADLVDRFEALEPDKRKAVLDLVREDIGTLAPSASVHASVSPELVERINARLERQRKNHPSFQLMNGGYSEGLSPKGERRDESDPVGPIPNSQRIVKIDGNIDIHFRDFLQNSWEDDGQTHLFITGRGGVGKTVALLTFATEEGFLREALPAIYIPLYDLAQYAGSGLECIDRYIEQAFSSDESETIKRLSHEPWNNGPSVILLLDGHNEIPADRIRHVDADIRAWAERPGTQLVTTSRVPGLFGVAGTRWLELQPLSMSDVKTYLAQRELAVPEEGGTLWKVLETPLMLKLYAETSNRPQRMQQPYLNWKPTNSAGDLVWNYLQRELWRMIDLHGGDYERIEYAAALLLTLPYVCYRMETRHEFRISEDTLDEYIEDACVHLLERKRPPRFAKVERKLRARLNTIGEENLVYSQLGILESETGLFGLGPEGYALLHQSLRDGLAAIHIRNVMETEPSYIPEEFRRPISEYVKDFLADLCEADASEKNPLLQLWEASRTADQNREGLDNPTVTHNLLRVIHKRFDGGLSMLNWSGMDLRDESLFPYRSGMKLRISNNPYNFIDTKIDIDCFKTCSHLGSTNSICFSPNGTVLASASDDGTVRLWDVTTGQPIYKPVGHSGKVRFVSFLTDETPSKNGNQSRNKVLLVSGSHSELRQWEYQGEYIGPKSKITLSGDLIAARFSKNGTLLLASKSHAAVMLWDARSGTLVHKLEGHFRDVTAVCFSPDGTRVASGSADHTIRLWDTETGELVNRLTGHSQLVTDISFSPDGAVIASSSNDNTVQLWDARSGTLVHKLEGHSRDVTAVCFSPDGTRVASGSADHTIRLWDTETGELISKLEGYSNKAISIGFTPDGLLLACGYGDGAIRLWDASTGHLLHQIQRLGKRVKSIRFSPDGSIFAGSFDDQTVRLWDAKTGELLHVLRERGEPVGIISFSNDARVVASGSDNGGARVWCTTSGELVCELDEPFSSVWSVCLSPDGSHLASGSRGKNAHSVRLWDVKTATDKLVREFEGYEGMVRSVCFSPDGVLLASGSRDHSVRLWEVSTGKLINDQRWHGREVLSVCFSPKGNLLASSSGDNTVRLWDAKTGEFLCVLRGHTKEVAFSCFSPSETMLASCSDDGTIRLWDIKNIKENKRGQLVQEIHLGSRVRTVCFSPDGLLASGSDDGVIRFFNTPSSTATNYHSLSITDTIEPLFGIDLTGLDLSLAIIDDPHDREVLRQNGVIVPPEPVTDPESGPAPC